MKTQSLPATLTALKILNILKEQSDCDHPIAQTKLAEMLDVDRKTIGRCLEVMEGFMDCDIVHTKKGVYLIPDDDAFELSEIRLLIDSVLSSKVISADQTESIVNKLAKQVNRFDRGHIRHIHTYKQWSKIDNSNIFFNIEEIDDAISSKCQVSFDYNQMQCDKKLHIIGKYTVTPVQLVFSAGMYFVLTLSDEDETLRSFRIDRITNVKKLSKLPALTLTRHLDFEDIASAYVEGHPYMSFGTTEPIKIQIKKEEIGRLFDVFGTKVTISSKDIKEDVDTPEVRLVANTQDVFLWALQNSDVAEVIEPQSLREQLMQALRAAKKKYLSTSEDIYLAEMDKLTNSKEFENQPERATMDFSDIDLTQFETYKNIDVCKYRFWKAKLQDISFVAGKKLLQSFYSFENPIADYLPLSKAKNLQDVSIIFSDIDSLDFVPKCRCLRSLTLGGTKIKDATAIYQTLSPQLEYLKLFWGSEIDVELFKKFNPKTKVIVGRKEAEDRDNQIHLMDVNERFTKYEYPLNVIDSSLGLEAHGASAKEIEEIRQKLVVNQEAFAKIEQQLFRTETTRAVVMALYYEGKSILEVACDLSMTIPEVLKTRKIATRIHTDEFLEVEHDFIFKHRGEVTEEDVAWFKNLLEEYQLKKNREKYN